MRNETALLAEQEEKRNAAQTDHCCSGLHGYKEHQEPRVWVKNSQRAQNPYDTTGSAHSYPSCIQPAAVEGQGQESTSETGSKVQPGEPRRTQRLLHGAAQTPDGNHVGGDMQRPP